MKGFVLFLIVVFSVGGSLPVFAQEAEPVVQAVETQIPVAEEMAINPGNIPSLLFTFWEYSAIKDARGSRGRRRAPTDSELTRDLNMGQNTNRLKPPPEERDISLGGIVYVSGNDWTIWLNGKRVTPKAIPSEVIDLSVHKEYIELKWLDDWTNQIFPIRLRPHQRFNVDTRIFLPG